MQASTSSYHVGFVVADLATSADQFTSLLGIEWVDPITRSTKMEVGDRHDSQVIDLTFTYTFSRASAGSCLIELIQGTESGPWQIAPGIQCAFHHIGFWCVDLCGTSASLADRGAKFLLTECGVAERNLLAHHQLPAGPRIELVDIARKPSFSELIGAPPDPQAHY